MPPPDSNNQQDQPQGAPGEEETKPGAPKLIVIAGPTAVGKTRLGIELSLRFDGEVINADSRYFYRGMDIGVAKPDIVERRGVPHHLVDILDPNEEMSLAIYQERAMQAIYSVLARGHVPFLVGGTPLYINAVVEGWRIPPVPPNPEFRARMEDKAARLGVSALAERLAVVDPVAAKRCGTNLRRIIRALEVYEATGVPMSQQEGKGPRPFDTLEFGLTMPRAQLYEAIDRRVDDQIQRGLVEEVRLLLEGGVPPDAPAMSALGYRQLLPYFRGETTLDEAIARIKLDTHRYVRHQETWLRRNPRLIPIDVTQPDWIERAAALVAEFLGRPPRDPVPERWEG